MGESLLVVIDVELKRSPFELDSGIRENRAQINGGDGHVTTDVDG